MEKNMHYKIIKCGDIFEVIEYVTSVKYDFVRDNIKNVRKASDETETTEKREDNLLRARQSIRHYIWSNIGRYPKFLTLTYADNMQDYEQFKKDWYRFIERMKRKGFKLRYLYVLEYQERGALHAHVVIFNDEFIPHDIISAAWRKGFVKVNAIDHVRNLGAYVCKYLNKSDMNYYGSYAYHVSRGLNKPEILRLSKYDKSEIQALLDSVNVTYQDTIFDEYTRTFVTYKQGKLK